MHLDVRAFEPPPLKQMTEDFMRAYKTTIDFWAEDFKIKPLVPVDVKEMSEAGPVTQDDNVKVSAIIVEHPPVKPALRYRFDFKDLLDSSPPFPEHLVEAGIVRTPRSCERPHVTSKLPDGEFLLRAISGSADHVRQPFLRSAGVRQGDESPA